MIHDYSKGGLKMIDIASFNQALKMKWVKSYLDDQDTGKWKLFFNHRLGQFGVPAQTNSNKQLPL